MDLHRQYGRLLTRRKPDLIRIHIRTTCEYSSWHLSHTQYRKSVYVQLSTVPLQGCSQLLASSVALSCSKIGIALSGPGEVFFPQLWSLVLSACCSSQQALPLSCGDTFLWFSALCWPACSLWNLVPSEWTKSFPRKETFFYPGSFTWPSSFSYSNEQKQTKKSTINICI